MELHPVWRFWSLVCILLVPASATIILTSNTTAWLLAGQDSVTLYCKTQNPNAYIHWSLNGQPLPGDPHHQIITGLFNIQSTLTISPVSKTDAGNFTCAAFNGTAVGISNALSLNLTWSPTNNSIICGVEPVNDSVRFTCSWPGGTPAANINLTFNGTVQSGQDIVTTYVRTGNGVQQPELICEGDHMGKKSRCNTTFERPQSTSPNGTLVTLVKEGGNVTVTVTLNQNVLQPQFSWFHLNQGPVPIHTTSGKFEVYSNNSQSTLHITNVTVRENGTYECTASNIIGSKTFLFYLQVTPIGLQESLSTTSQYSSTLLQGSSSTVSQSSSSTTPQSSPTISQGSFSMTSQGSPSMTSIGSSFSNPQSSTFSMASFSTDFPASSFAVSQPSFSATSQVPSSTVPQILSLRTSSTGFQGSSSTTSQGMSSQTSQVSSFTASQISSSTASQTSLSISPSLSSKASQSSSSTASSFVTFQSSSPSFSQSFATTVFANNPTVSRGFSSSALPDFSSTTSQNSFSTASQSSSIVSRGSSSTATPVTSYNLPPGSSSMISQSSSSTASRGSPSAFSQISSQGSSRTVLTMSSTVSQSSSPTVSQSSSSTASQSPASTASKHFSSTAPQSPASTASKYFSSTASQNSFSTTSTSSFTAVFQGTYSTVSPSSSPVVTSGSSLGGLDVGATIGIVFAVVAGLILIRTGGVHLIKKIKGRLHSNSSYV